MFLGQLLAQLLVTLLLELLGMGLDEAEDTVVKELPKYDREGVLVERTEEYR